MPYPPRDCVAVAEATCVFPPDDSLCGPVSLDEGGVLPPGLYTLEARASGTGQGGWWGGPPDGGNSGDFDIVLTPDRTPVPALSARDLALLVALIAAVGARRVSSTPARSRGVEPATGV